MQFKNQESISCEFCKKEGCGDLLLLWLDATHPPHPATIFRPFPRQRPLFAKPLAKPHFTKPHFRGEKTIW